MRIVVPAPTARGKVLYEALALAEQCLRIARRKTPPVMVTHNGRRWKGFPMPPSTDNEEDPVRHDFGRPKRELPVHWASGGRIHMIWPEEHDEEEGGYFYLDEEVMALSLEPRRPLGPSSVRLR